MHEGKSGSETAGGPCKSRPWAGACLGGGSGFRQSDQKRGDAQEVSTLLLHAD